MPRSCQRTSRRHAVTSHDVTWCQNVFTKWICAIYTGDIIKKSENHVFQYGDLDLWPMTLTFELIRDFIKVNVPTYFWVRMSNRSTMRALNNRQTHRHTGLYPRPLTREGKIKTTLLGARFLLRLGHRNDAKKTVFETPLLHFGLLFHNQIIFKKSEKRRSDFWKTLWLKSQWSKCNRGVSETVILHHFYEVTLNVLLNS